MRATPQGDYGLGFFGNALQSGSYYVEDPTLGPLCYLCDVRHTDGGGAGGGGGGGGPAVAIIPRDAYSIAAFLEPFGLYLTSECGKIGSIELPTTAAVPRHVAGGAAAAPSAASDAPRERTLRVTFRGGAAPCEMLRLKLTKTALSRPGSGFAVAGAPLVRGAYQLAPAAGGADTVAVVTWSA